MADYLRESGVKWIWEKIKTLLSAKQDKLVSGTNIKTINGSSVLGSGDIAISGDSTGDVDEGRLVWSDEDSPSTLMDIAYLNGNGNKIAGIPPSLVTIEYSADNGATWRDSGISDASKIRLTNHRINGSVFVLPNGSTTLDINYQTRITIDLIEDSATNAWAGGFEFRKIILKCSGIQRNDTHTMTVEMQKYGSTTWDIIKVSRFWGSPGFFSISTPKRTVGYPSASYYRKVRLTWQTGDVYTNRANISGIFFMSDNTVGLGGGKEPSQYAITGTPYSVDYNQNVTFPNAIKGKKLITDGGKSTQVVKGDGSLEEESALAVASAIDAEHAEEADYAGVADKADKLTTARKIGLTGGAVGTGTNFDGSASINIPVTKIDEGILAWSENYAPTGTLLDNIMKISGNNVLAYMPPSAITIEYSTDNGVTWLDYEVSDANKTRFVTPELGSYRLRLGKDLGSAPLINDRLRITFDFIAGGIRFTPSKVTLKLESLGNNDDFHTKISTEMYANYNQDVWENVADQRNVIPDWGTYKLTGADWGFASAKYRARLRCEFYRTATSVNRTGITNMILMATKITNANNYAKTGHVYSLDIHQNATFPNAITATKHITQGGTANQVVLGNGSLRPISELSPITDADAEILLDNHIHSIDVNANGNDVNISVIESSKNGDTWETEDNDITIPLATTTSAGVMSKEDKIKSDGLLIYYHLTEDEYNNHEIVSLYPLVLVIKDALFDSSTNKWKYDDSKTYDIRVKGWTLQDNGITYLNVNVRLLTSQGGHSIGFSGFVDVDFITETYFDATIPLYIGYICGKYHIENDDMTIVAPEDSGFYIEI